VRRRGRVWMRLLAGRGERRAVGFEAHLRIMGLTACLLRLIIVRPIIVNFSPISGFLMNPDKWDPDETNCDNPFVEF